MSLRRVSGMDNSTVVVVHSPMDLVTVTRGFEDLYRVDRMFTQLKLAGVLDGIRGLVFGTCAECGPGEGFASLTLEEILADHVKPLGVPAWFGAMIGHQMPQWTVPVGADAEIDATKATIRLLAPAVR